MSPAFLFGALCGAVLFILLYNGTGESILMVTIWHGLFDLLTASRAGQDIILMVTSAGIITRALYVANISTSYGDFALNESMLSSERSFPPGTTRE